MRKNRIRRTVGDVVVIPLRDGSFGYGIVLKAPEMAFYNCRSSQILSLSEIVCFPAIFRLLIQDEFIKNGSWPIIGRTPLSNDFLIPQPYFVWGPFQARPFITYDGSETIWSTPEQCQGLERAMIWCPEIVSERLCDSLTGNRDRWMQKIENEQ